MQNLLPGGFNELTPENQAIENSIKDIIQKNYIKFGYANIETPAVELNEILTSKGGNEIGKQIYGLYGLKQGGSDLKGYSLHFDLTVPLARYVVQNEQNIKFPFKRNQIQKVWRGEKQQRGRFKEFIQADVDVIGEDLPLNYDIEVIKTLYSTIQEIFNFLKIEKNIEVHLNNKKFIEGICKKFQIEGEQKTLFFGLLDNYYKVTKANFDSKMKEIVGEDLLKIKEILDTPLEEMKENDEYINEGISELKKIYLSLKNSGINIIFDPYITRGLDYYTGTVFETFISEYFNFGSICSGGRYDNLVKDIRNIGNKGVEGKNYKDYCGVGGSIGLSRLFTRLEESGFINKKIPLTEVIIFNTNGSEDGYKEKIAGLLRNEGISTDIYYSEAKLGKQFTYAENKNIPIGIFAGENEEKENNVIVKDLDTREQELITINELTNYIKKKLYEIIK